MANYCNGATSRHLDLMEAFATVMDLCRREAIAFWPEFGTLIGVLRHQNIIPWDYDADIALMQDDYRRLCTVFEASPGRRIGRLVMRPDYYGEPESCCCLLIDDNTDEGIDVCAYRRDGDTLVTCMSGKMQEKWPGIYSWPAADVFPLQRRIFLGDELWIPARPEAILNRAYSYDGSHYPSDTTPFSAYPAQDHAEWIQALAAERSGAADAASIQTLADKLCAPPFRTVREFASVTEGWAWADRQQAQQQRQPSEKDSSPEADVASMSRADDANLACRVPIEEPFVVRCSDAERAETATCDEIWAALSREPHPVFGWKSMVDYEHVEVAAVRNLWQQDRLRVNIVDSELSDPASVRLPLAMRSNPRVARLSYIVSNRDARTGLHTDPPAAGAGWMMLVEGRKVWWWITAHDMVYLAALGWSEEALSALGAENGCGEATPAPSVVSPAAVVSSIDVRSDGSTDSQAASGAAAVAEVQQRGTLVSLLRVCDGYLWGRIIVGVCSGGDLVYTPPLCAHAVRTHERALGLGGYSRVF